nr:hydantoinase B/oxoprolinase family protein [Rhodoglobus vestalii]
MRPASARLDPVTVEVIRNAFDSIAAQMNNSLARSAYTPIIYEMKDCSVGLFNADGELLGQSSGLPIFLGALDVAIDVTTEHIGGAENYREGDVFAINDSYLVGSHLNDISIFSPIFYEGRLVGFGATKAHWLDIGAKDAGQAMDSTSIYQEGYRLGPTYLYRAGVADHQMIDFLMRNSRLPRSVWGDMHAQIAACHTGERMLKRLYERFGSATVEGAAKQVFDQCERLDREAVAAIPDGIYRAEGALDSWGPAGGPVPVKLTVTVSGDQIVLDLTGSSPQTPGSMNCGRAQTVSAARLAYKLLVNPEIPATAGTFRNVSVVTTPRTVFDAREPAACQFYYPHLGMMVDLFVKALASALPHAVNAGQPADAMNILFAGYDDNGIQFFCSEATGVGWGGLDDLDGVNGRMNYGGGDLKNYPVEVIESRYPLRVTGYGLQQNSGGAGEYRGGLGIWRSYETLSEQTTVSLWFERSKQPAWGLFGGEDGAPTDVVIDRGGGEEHILKVNALPLPKGSQVRIQTGGGGGYGDPGKRNPEALKEDLLNGYVTESPVP